jgi:hypothetical protein
MPQACARALGLLSGGLDSTLAARLLLEQGVEVRAVHFSTGFCMVDHRRLLGRPSDRAEPARVRNQALRAAGYLGVPVEIVDVASEFLREVVLAPKHGYGTAMNPCIDCRVFMLRKAGEMGITGYPTPGGGCCFLADRNFARRLRDLVSHGAVESLEPGEVLLLKVGRHFRLGYDVKAVFGRDESESTFLKRFAGSRLWTCHVADGRGSFGVVQGEPSRDRARQLAALAARYSRHREREQVQVRLARGGKDRLLDVPPAPEELLRKWLI